MGRNGSSIYTSWEAAPMNSVWIGGFLVDKKHRTLSGRFDLKASYIDNAVKPCAIEFNTNISLSPDNRPEQPKAGGWSFSADTWQVLTDPAARSVALAGAEVKLGPITNGRRSVLLKAPYPLPYSGSLPRTDAGDIGSFFTGSLSNTATLLQSNVFDHCDVGFQFDELDLGFRLLSSKGGSAKGLIVSGDTIVSEFTVTDDGLRTLVVIKNMKGIERHLKPSFRMAKGHTTQIDLPGRSQAPAEAVTSDESIELSFLDHLPN